MRIYPNPHCSSIFIHPLAGMSNGVASVYDFYGNLQATQALAEDVPTEIRLPHASHLWLVLSQNGRVVGLQAAVRHCP